jgi:hypothetical protein
VQYQFCNFGVALIYACRLSTCIELWDYGGEHGQESEEGEESEEDSKKEKEVTVRPRPTPTCQLS